MKSPFYLFANLFFRYLGARDLFYCLLASLVPRYADESDLRTCIVLPDDYRQPELCRVRLFDSLGNSIR